MPITSKRENSSDNPLKHLTKEELEAVEYSFFTILREVRGDLNFHKAYKRSNTMDADRIHHAIEYLLNGTERTMREVFSELKEGQRIDDTSAIEVEPKSA